MVFSPTNEPGTGKRRKEKMSSAKKSILALGSLAAHVVAQSVSVPPVLNGTATVVPQSSVWTYWNTTVSTVTVVDELTTVCVEKTTLTFNECEYPVTKGETLVVTNCPCTLTTVSFVCHLNPPSPPSFFFFLSFSKS